MFSPPPWRRVNTKRQKSKPAGRGRAGGVTLHLKGAAENWRLQRTNAHRIRNAPPRPPSVSLSFLLVSSARPLRPRLSLFI